jgi:hypothetical protein
VRNGRLPASALSLSGVFAAYGSRGNTGDTGGGGGGAQTVEFYVSGPPADVTYGPTGSQHQGHVPMDVTEPLGNPQYYAIDAQLDSEVISVKFM